VIAHLEKKGLRDNTLIVVPTILAAAGAKQPKMPLTGMNLLPVS
jgi:arylsulfatase A-like enzyme